MCSNISNKRNWIIHKRIDLGNILLKIIGFPYFIKAKIERLK